MKFDDDNNNKNKNNKQNMRRHPDLTHTQNTENNFFSFLKWKRMIDDDEEEE